ncbi:MAG: hypothetical protein F4Z05_00510 [Chloroflexi bacterium]|nr:hypothetical protein [Chloroflexota bacterium]
MIRGERAVTTGGTYRTASRHLLTQARAELSQGDVRQASEKGWGAAAQMVKAIAEQRGWEHRGHRQIHQAVVRLAEETGNEDIRRFFQVASSLHANFYEDWETDVAVGGGLSDIARLLDLLEPLA